MRQIDALFNALEAAGYECECPVDGDGEIDLSGVLVPPGVKALAVLDHPDADTERLDSLIDGVRFVVGPADTSWRIGGGPPASTATVAETRTRLASVLQTLGAVA